jgi:hypothetical protein
MIIKKKMKFLKKNLLIINVKLKLKGFTIRNFIKKLKNNIKR